MQLFRESFRILSQIKQEKAEMMDVAQASSSDAHREQTGESWVMRMKNGGGILDICNL